MSVYGRLSFSLLRRRGAKENQLNENNNNDDHDNNHSAFWVRGACVSPGPQADDPGLISNSGFWLRTMRCAQYALDRYVGQTSALYLPKSKRAGTPKHHIK